MQPLFKSRLAKPLKLLIISGASIFVSETAVMLILAGLPPLSVYSEAFLDSALLSLFVFPLLYLLLFRPMLKNIQDLSAAEEGLHEYKGELEKRVIDLEEIQKRLRESEDEYRRLFNNNPNPMWIYDLETLSFLLVNDSAVRHYGYSREEFLSMTIKDIRPPEDVPALLENVSRVTEGLDKAGVWRHRKKDGRVILVEVTSHTINFRGRRGRVVLAHDVTDRVKAEEELIRTKEKLSAMVDERTDELQRANKELAVRADALEKRNREINILSRMMSTHQACNTVEEAYTVIARHSSELFPDDSGELLIVNPSTNIMEVAAFWGKTAPLKGVFTAEDCWGLRLGRVHVFKREGADLKCPHVESRGMPYICVPMIAQGRPVGVFHLEMASSYGAEHYDEKMREAEQLILTLSENISLSLSNIMMRETLRSLSIHDPLTGLYNRRYMEEFLRREALLSNRTKNPIGVIMVDIDHFKHFNDTYGHDAGDSLLVEMASHLMRMSRASDVVCRLGGEEFVVAMPGASKEVAKERAERLREGAHGVRVLREGVGAGATISMGVAVFPSDGGTVEAVLKAADEALYAAKNAGRDRVSVYGEGVKSA